MSRTTTQTSMDSAGGRSVGADPPPAPPGTGRPQAPYEGSARQARGEVLAALRAVGPEGVVASAFPDAVLTGLAADGLVTRAGDRVLLP